MISANSGDSEAKGINIMSGEVDKVSDLKIYDHRYTKEWAIRLASEAAITILRIDQIIVAKPAGGPKMQQNKNWDEDNWLIDKSLPLAVDTNKYHKQSRAFYIFLYSLHYPVRSKLR